MPARAQPALAFNARDWIVVSDFENLTGDDVFDRSLRVAVEVGVAQSQYVNVFPPQLAMKGGSQLSSTS